MKDTLFILLLAILSGTTYAQQQGKIKFLRINKLSFEAPEGMEDMFKNMPTERTAQKELLFTQEKSLYRNATNPTSEDSNELTAGDDENQIVINFQEPEEFHYINIPEDKSIHQFDFLNKKFLMTGPQSDYQWKLGDRKLKVKDYICAEANAQLNDSVSITAWFAPEIPVSMGPAGYGGLPGMILKVEQSDGKVVLVADAIEFTDVDEAEIKAPKKGQKVTQEAFEKIKSEKMKEMNMSPGGGIQIHIEEGN